VALFFLSFLPQFVSPRAESAFPALLVLGLTFLTTGTIWCLALALGSAWFSERMISRSVAGGLLKRLSGLLFLGLGIRLALSRAQ
jgi:threonine/homoserine/homoserine lactone efflux protein